MTLRRLGGLSMTLLAAIAVGCSSTVGAGDTGASDSSDVLVNDAVSADVAASDAVDATPADVPSDQPSDARVRVPQYHRTSDATCGTTPPPGGCQFGGHGSMFMCAMDSDCASGTNGRCATGFGGPAFCGCTYDTCAHDSDCTMGGPCSCHGSPFQGGVGNLCLPGNCRVDADCGAHGFCSPTRSTMNCGEIAGYYCHTPADDCTDDSDCVGSGGGQLICTFNSPRGRWICMQQQFCA